MLEDLETARLVGYEAPADMQTGFCTALYAAHAQSNQVFLAAPAIEGDRNSSVSFFETVIPDQNVNYLNAEDCREVSVGDPWRDAFLMEGKFHFGTPTELSDLIGGLGKLSSEYPLTALDFVSNHPGKARREAMAVAYGFVAEKIGLPNAKRWMIEAHLRNHLLVILRRRLNAKNASMLAFETMRHLQVILNEDIDTISINLLHLPEGMTPQDVDEVEALTNDDAVSLLMNDLPGNLKGLKLRTRLGKASVSEPYVPKPVLIVPFGRDAARLARSFSDTNKGPRFIVDPSWPNRMFEVWDDYELDRLNSKKLRDYSILVALVDENSYELAVHPGLTAIKEMLKRKDAPQLLVAPVLPLDRPSQHFEPESQMSFFDSFHSQLLLDTSFVRSPLWSGSQNTSLSRRLVDQVEKTCLVLLSEPDVLGRILERKKRQPRSVLCVYPSKPNRRVASKFDYLSETAAFSTTSERQIARTFLEAINQSNVQRRMDSGKYDLALRPMGECEFEDLATQAWADASKYSGVPYEVQSTDENSSFASPALNYPNYSAELLLFDEPKKRHIFFTAETPSLEQVRLAEKAGRQVVRYTDRFSLKKLSNPERQCLWEFELPEDFQPLKRLPEVDGPSVFRRASDWGIQLVLAEAWRLWVARHPNHPLTRVGKYILPTGLGSSGAASPLVAISERELERAARFDDRGLEELSRLFVPNRSHDASVVLFESFENDELHTGISRWVFREGRYPIVPRRLPDWLTVPRGWIAFDGDIYSAAVVASGALETWLKGHSPRGSGWGRRAVRQNDLDGFPWPDAFELIGYPATVSFPEPPRSFSAVVHDLSFPELTEEFRDPSQRELEIEIDFDTRQALLAETLDLYGLSGLRGEGEALTLLRDLAARNVNHRIGSTKPGSRH